MCALKRRLANSDKCSANQLLPKVSLAEYLRNTLLDLMTCLFLGRHCALVVICCPVILDDVEE
jgi:hypothetical protein